MKLHAQPSGWLDTWQAQYCNVAVMMLLPKTSLRERFSAQAKSELMCCVLCFTTFLALGLLAQFNRVYLLAL
jgi:hypothetical protein